MSRYFRDESQEFLEYDYEEKLPIEELDKLNLPRIILSNNEIRVLGGKGQKVEPRNPKPKP